MSKLLIVKVGSTFPALAARRGDFEDWILLGLQVDQCQIRVVDVVRGVPLPAYDEISGVVVTGSHAMVTERQPWSENTASWLAGAIERGMPTLGICYGHQLLAWALGGTVGDNPNGREFGTVEIRLTDCAQQDRLLGGLPNKMLAQVCHTQSVLQLPLGATLLASSDMDPHQAFVVGDTAWGVQFHPEFDAEIVVAYIERYRQALLAADVDPDQLISSCFDTTLGTQILRRFSQIVHDGGYQ
jgi:GMP synthase (glutamine-hydrolysing)